MKVKSTGLGRTLLQCHPDGFRKKGDGDTQSLVMVITSTEPVHWHIECDLGGKDIRQMAAQMLKPAIVWQLIKLLISGSEAKGFDMGQEGGRRSSRERVSRDSAGRAVGLAETEAGATATSATAGPTLAATATVPAAGSATLPAAGPAAPSNGTPAPQSTASGNGTPSNGTKPAPAPAPASERQAPPRIVTNESDLTARTRRREQQRRQREEMAKKHAAEAVGVAGYTEESRRELSNG